MTTLLAISILAGVSKLFLDKVEKEKEPVKFWDN